MIMRMTSKIIIKKRRRRRRRRKNKRNNSTGFNQTCFRELYTIKNEFNEPQALVKIKDYYEALSLEKTKFKRYLSKLYYDS